MKLSETSKFLKITAITGLLAYGVYKISTDERLRLQLVELASRALDFGLDYFEGVLDNQDAITARENELMKQNIEWVDREWKKVM